MRLTVLGRCGGYPSPGEACTAHVVEAGNQKLLIDVGYGVVSRLLQRYSPYAISGLILSHLHPDHVAEVPALQLALEYWQYPPTRWEGKLPALAPDGARDHLARFGPADEGKRIVGYFDLRRIEPGVDQEFCGFQVRFARACHVVEAYAVRLVCAGRVLVYTGDTAPSEAVEALACGADVLLAEATFPDRLAGPTAHFAHLTGTTAGQLAARAGVGKLFLTHFFPGTDPGEQIQAARRQFSGPVEAVAEGWTYEI